MNWIRSLRDQAGVTQQTLAVRARTSQPTIALYESGAKSPTLATLRRLAKSVGFDLAVAFTPHLTREDLRSLAYHATIVRILRKDPISTKKRAKHALDKMMKRHPEAGSLFDRWSFWLTLPMEELISRILDPGMEARDMRQVTPFSGLIASRERAKILRQFRKEYGS